MIAALDVVRAGLEQARADSTEAVLDFNRQKQLLESGSTTKAAFEISQARYMSAVAGVKSAIAAVRAAEVSLENTYIRAPFKGTVLSKHADVGEVVAPFASSASSKGSVVDLADMSSLEVEADVSEANIQRVSVGQGCDIILDAYPDIRYKGVVKKIVPTADRSRATVLTKVAFTEIDSRVLPEMSARINFMKADNGSDEKQSGPTIAMPSTALLSRGGKQIAFTITNDKAQELTIDAGRKIGGMVEIKGGAQPGQKVILSPPADLKNGDKVTIVE
jgi:RND family efflux transporter MFP subunit